MSVVNGVGTIGWPGLNISDRNSWVPTYGNWGGPGWSGGTRTDDLGSVYDVEPAKNSLGQTSMVDAACKQRDIDYWNAKGQVNEAELISKADLDLLQALNSIPISQMDATEMAYTLLATDAFAGKLLEIDLPAEIREKVINAANEIVDKLQGMLPQNLKDFVDSITSGNLLTDGIKLNNIINNLLGLFGSATAADPPRWCDPLIIDLDGDGIETVASTDGAFFDHDGNGFAERTGWVSGDDGLLVRDINSDGIINNGGELFGDQTLLANGQKAAGSFQALADLDSNLDGKIDANDAAFSQLRIWQDADGDGYSSADELKTLSELGITALNTGYTDTNISDGLGNTQIQAGTFEKSDSTTGQLGGFLLQRNTAYTIPEEYWDQNGVRSRNIRFRVDESAAGHRPLLPPANFDSLLTHHFSIAR